MVRTAKVLQLIRPIKVLVAGLLIISSSIGFAQVIDNFSDNDFSTNPIWIGDNDNFTIDNFRLRLQAPAVAGISFLSTASESINDATWEFYVQMDFNPSGSNYCKVYLTSDQQDLSSPLNGYYLLIGDAQDEVSLYRQSGTDVTKIIDGPDGLVNLASVSTKIKVTRTSAGNWELFTDVGVAGIYVSQGAVSDQVHRVSHFFGIECVYTSTRSDKFYFDDFTVTGDPYVDSDPPEITSIEIASTNSIIINFNEPLHESSALLTDNYSIDNQIGTPLSAQLLNANQSVLLTFIKSFRNGFTHQLQINNVADQLGNTISLTTKQFFFFQPTTAAYKDVILTELLADPSPQISLPDAEYIELFNRSKQPFNLKDWILSDGSSKSSFPEYYFLPNEYLVVTSTSNVNKFGSATSIVGVPNFPTLNNTTDTLTLKSPSGLTIDSVNYDLSWYKDVDKQEGGWALEIIDANNICGENENWTSSESEEGGTPGRINSVSANKPDVSGPRLINAIALDKDRLMLVFNEKLEKPISTAANFNISPSIEIISFTFMDRSLTTVQLILSPVLVEKQLYTIQVENIFDCSGNKISDEHKSFAFALPEPAEPLDVVINEILFNPRPNGSDFVEVYNRSDKFVNLKGWQIGNVTEGVLENGKILSLIDLIISPEEYIALTPSPENIKTNYPQSDDHKLFTSTLPSLPDDEGSVAIADSRGDIIDSFNYDASFHSPFLKDDEGVSLERISFFRESNDVSNWTSAASTVGFATPGYTNSSFKPAHLTVEGEVVVDPPIFSTATGFNEFSQIQFRFDRAGFIANVKIFDHQGRLIKTLANNVLLGTEGAFRWDGDHDDGSRARTGYYLVWFEVFDNSGVVKSFRKRVVIASR